VEKQVRQVQVKEVHQVLVLQEKQVRRVRVKEVHQVLVLLAEVKGGLMLVVMRENLGMGVKLVLEVLVKVVHQVRQEQAKEVHQVLVQQEKQGMVAKVEK
jgi:hypothetical protein